MSKEEKEKLEQMKRDLRWDCSMAYTYTGDKWFNEKYKEFKPPIPKTITKKEALAKIRAIKRLEKKLSTKK